MPRMTGAMALRKRRAKRPLPSVPSRTRRGRPGERGRPPFSNIDTPVARKQRNASASAAVAAKMARQGASSSTSRAGRPRTATQRTKPTTGRMGRAVGRNPKPGTPRRVGPPTPSPATSLGSRAALARKLARPARGLAPARGRPIVARERPAATTPPRRRLPPVRSPAIPPMRPMLQRLRRR